jgi:hypothetical protein
MTSAGPISRAFIRSRLRHNTKVSRIHATRVSYQLLDLMHNIDKDKTA